MNEMLMNCPCCGAKAVVSTSRRMFYELVVENGSACLSIQCTDSDNCGIQLYCFHDSIDYGTMLQKATEQWNRRSYG